jgi:hypothetical protein
MQQDPRPPPPIEHGRQLRHLIIVLDTPRGYIARTMGPDTSFGSVKRMTRDRLVQLIGIRICRAEGGGVRTDGDAS